MDKMPHHTQPSVKVLPRYSGFYRFSRWQPFAVLDFKKSGILMADSVKMVKMCDLAKFCSGRSNCSEIWRFINVFDMMAVRHLGFVMRVVWTTYEEHLVLLFC